MRTFLYISPWFPPSAMVGALRPLKFLHHLEELGWRAVVLCDGDRGHGNVPNLVQNVPLSSIVVRDYSRSASRTNQSSSAPTGELPERASCLQSSDSLKSSSDVGALMPSVDRHAIDAVMPLGRDLFGLGFATSAALRALAEHPECEAIMVSSDPQSGLIVGERVRAKTGLPLILDLRDPWSICELLRPLRWAPWRWMVDRLERKAVNSASKVILNTETALRDYRRHYGDVPSERFCCIRNSTDRSLMSSGRPVQFDRFTLLFLGRLRRHVEGDVLIHVLKSLSERGLGTECLQLVVTSRLPDRVRQLADEKGVTSYILERDAVPYTQAGAIMDAADVLVSLGHQSQQRIAAKTFDYLSADRPIVNISDNRELRNLLADVEGCESFGLTDYQAIADHIEDLARKGRHQTFRRSIAGLDSRSASAKLARVLHEVAGKKLG